MILEKLKIRSANDKDRNFILKTWLKNYKKSNFASEIDPSIYYEAYQNAVKNCLSRSTVSILCDEEDPNFIYAFFVLDEHTEANVLHFLYVRDDFRNWGIAKQIYKQFLANKFIFYTHKTKMINGQNKAINVSAELAEKVGAVYNPFLFFKSYL